MKLAVAVVGAVVFSAACFVTAFAHAEPATAKPGDGAILTSPPAEVVLTMSQDMFDQAGANDIDIVNAAGNEVTTVSAVLDRSNRKRLTVSVPSNLAPGAYTVKWKTLSADDGDPAEGTLSFTFDPNGTANPGNEQVKPDVLAPAETPGGETSTPSLAVTNSPDGVTWVLVVAVGAAMFVLGAGGAFLLIQRHDP
jgi:methionine-rich copper-binding protein CopC